MVGVELYMAKVALCTYYVGIDPDRIIERWNA